MGPNDPTQITMAVIESVLNPHMGNEDFPTLGFNLPNFLDKGVDNLEKVCQRTTRAKLLAEVRAHMQRLGVEATATGIGEQPTALEALHYLKGLVTHALLDQTGSLFGVDNVEPNSTNPFRAACASVVNAELRRIYRELYLGSLDTPGEELLHDAMRALLAVHERKAPAVDPLLIRYANIKEEASHARS